MTILAIDTSNYTLGIALLREDTVIAEYITYLKKNHSVRAMPAVHSLLNDCDMAPQDLSKIVVAKGPGSYTGVRIGVTLAKTLAWSLDIPISAVSSLETLAANGRHFDGLISPIFDARRGQVYTGLYQYKNGLLEQVVPDQNVMLADWLEMLKEKDRPVLFLGHDTSLHKQMIEDVLGTKDSLELPPSITRALQNWLFSGRKRKQLMFMGLSRITCGWQKLKRNGLKVKSRVIG